MFEFQVEPGDYGPYYAKVTDEHDGDTVGLNVDLGFKNSIMAMNPISGKRQFSCRLFGIDAPELSTREGKDSLQWLQQFLPLGAKVQIISKDWDAYQGRYDAVLWLVYFTGERAPISINDAIVQSGHAVYKTF